VNYLLTITNKAGQLLGLILMILVLSENVKPQNSPFEPLIGSWSGSGQLFGAEAQFEMNWEHVLNEQFILLTFRNSFSDSNGNERSLKARAFYKSKGDGHFQGTWFDSRGKIIPLESAFEGSTLTTLWGTSETELGRTVYLIVADDKIEVDDYISKDGEWHKFGHAIYHRSTLE